MPTALVYLLDMGEPIRIYDLAYRMITLSGLTVYDDLTGEGDVEIKIIGLYPGEKLYEELLIRGVVRDSYHPKIKYANEAFMTWSELEPKLAELENAIESANGDTLKGLLTELVAGFR